jgi:hypothetical protein
MARKGWEADFRYTVSTSPSLVALSSRYDLATAGRGRTSVTETLSALVEAR